MSSYVPYLQIIENLPVGKGDIVYVISDILDIAKACRENGERFDCEKFINTMQDAVGETGTLMIPTFNWSFCKGEPFDYKKSMGQTGSLGNAALKMKGFKRTRHPMYSFAVWGKYGNFLFEMNTVSCFGKDTPFAFMHENNAKVISVGLKATVGNTFIHYVEQAVDVSWRYNKNFTAKYIGENGNEEEKTVSMFVRDLDINPQYISFDKFNNVMCTLGICEEFSINGIPFSAVKLPGMFEALSLDFRYNHAGNIYVFN